MNLQRGLGQPCPSLEQNLKHSGFARGVPDSWQRGARILSASDLPRLISSMISATGLRKASVAVDIIEL